MRIGACLTNNIDPLVFLSPSIIIILCISFILFLRRRHDFRWVVLFYALIAYSGAIALKVVVQTLTSSFIYGEFGTVSVPSALYLGMQTVIFEVLGAYLVAHYLFRHNRIQSTDADGYGASLAFWENAVLLGLFTLISLVADYLIIASNLLGSSIYDQLIAVEPALFYPPLKLLPVLSLGILERISSILIHYAWGFLTVIAATKRRPLYLYIALPMGLVDSLVPYAGTIGLLHFEIIFFVISICAVLIALFVRRREFKLPNTR